MKAHQYLATSIATLLATVGGQRANALPQGEAVAQGKANFKRDGGRMEIRASDRAVINFRGFNIDRNEAVTFLQPGAKSRVLNRVTDGNPTRIFGQLKANGKVTLVNPSGVFFENGSMVNVGGIIAAAGKISDADFIAGRNRFTELSGEVSNAGTIRAAGDVSLVGAHVSNSGIIQSGRGMVSMMAGDEVLVGERGGNVYVSRAATPGKAVGVSNTGKIVAKKALLGAGDFYSVAVQHSGEIRAEEVALRGGNGGRVEVSGKIDASARGKGRKGGRIEVTGETVALKGATLDASGDKGGGEVLVGGDWQGKGAVSRAQTTTVDAATVIQADAVKRGAGGKVVVWADGATQFDGQISARGLGAGQAGGQVETSGKLTLGVGQTARVDASSPQGKMGNWLLDPRDLIIEAGGTGTIGGDGIQEVDASVINSAAATVILTATNNITFSQSVAMTTAGAGLTAIAGGNLVVGDNMTIATNRGAINFTADSDTNGFGSLSLGGGSNLTTKGAAVTLTVDHGAAASVDGMTILGNIDTRAVPTDPESLGANSTLQVLGTDPAQNGVITIGRVSLNAGYEHNASYRGFTLRADEINFIGSGTPATPASVPGSVTGTGKLEFIQANVSTGIKLAADTEPSVAGQLDLTRLELSAFSAVATGESAFRVLSFGRGDSTAQMVIGDTGGAALNLKLMTGSVNNTNLKLAAGVPGIIANIDFSAPNAGIMEVWGSVMDLKKGFSSEKGIVYIRPARASDNVEILNMALPGQGTIEAGKLRLDTTMLKRIGDASTGLWIGNAWSPRDNTLTVVNPIELISPVGAQSPSLQLNSGGQVIFNATVNAGSKSLAISAGDIVNAGEIGRVTGSSALIIYPSPGPKGASSTRDLDVYDGVRLDYDTDESKQNVTNLRVADLNVLANQFTGFLQLGCDGQQPGGNVAIGGHTKINTPINIDAKKVNELRLYAPETLFVPQPVTVGKGGEDGTKTQNLLMRAREVDLQAALTGSGSLTIHPIDNTLQGTNVDPTLPKGNPLTRGMLIGTAAGNPDNVNHLTITEAEYNLIGTGFSRIVFGRGEMTGDLEVAGFAGAGAFKLKANTELVANSTVKLNVNTGGTLANDGALKRLSVKSRELDITSDVTDLSSLTVEFNDSAAQSKLPNPRSYIINRLGTSADNPSPNTAMDLNSSDLGHIKESVGELVIGIKYAPAPDRIPSNYSPVEVLNNWTLPTNTTLVSSLGDITVSGSIDGAKSLTLDTEGATRLVGSLGANTPLTAFSIIKGTDFAGVPPNVLPVVQKTVIGSLGGPAVKVWTTGDQTFSESVELLSGGTLEAGGTLTVSQTLAAGANDLALLANEMLLNGGAGGITGTRGLQLGTGTPATNMTFNGTTSVAGQLDLTQSKLQAIALAGFNKLTLGRADGTGSLSVKENFGLLQETLIQTGGGAINIEKQLDGAQKLTLSSGTGNITASAALGGTTALGDLTVLSTGTAAFQGAVNAATVSTDAGGSTSLSGGLVSTSGLQNYNDKIVLGADATLRSTGPDGININAGAEGNFALNVNTPGVTLLDGVIDVGSVATDEGGSTRLKGGGVKTSGGQRYNDQIVLVAPTTLESSGTGVTRDIEVNAGAVGDFALNVNTTGVTRLKGGITVGSVETNVGGTVELAATINTTGTQRYWEQAQLVGNTTLNGSTVTFGNTVAGGIHSLDVGGNAEFNGEATGLSALSVSGTTALNGGTVGTSGTQTYTGAVTLGKDAALQGSTVTFGNTVAGGTHSLNVTGNAEFNDEATGLTTLGVTGTTLLNTSVVTTRGAQTYGGKVTLAKDAVLTSEDSGDVTVSAGATGNKTLAINTSGVTQLGGGIAVGSIKTDEGGTVKLSGDIQTTGTQSYGEQAQLVGNTTLSGTSVSFAKTLAGGSNSLAVTGNAEFNGAATGLSTLSVSGTTALNGGTVETSGTQTYTGAVTLGKDATLQGSTVSFGKEVFGGTHSLTVAGNAVLKGAATGLSALSVSGTTALNGGKVETSGTQTYTGAVTLGSNAALSGSTVSFGNTVAGGSNSLAVTGNAEFNGAATGLSALSVSGTTALNGGTVGTSGTQTYTGAVTLGKDATLSGSTVSFGNTVAGGSNSLAVTGNAEFNGAATGLTTLSVSGTTALNGGTVGTSGTQTYTGAVTLGKDATLEGSTVTFKSTIAGGAKSLGVTGNAEFNGAVTGLSRLDVTGTTLLNTTGVSTSGDQTYGGKVTLIQGALLKSAGSGTVAIKGGAVGSSALDIQTGGVTQLGGGINVASLSTDEGGSTQITGDVTTTGAQTYGDAVQVTGPVALSSSNGGALTLKAGADGAGSVSLATGGNVTVTGDSGTSGALENFSATGARVEVGGVRASGDVTLDASDLLVLQGASYKAADTISLNPTPRAASGRSSIVKPSGDVAFESDKFVMGAEQKLVVSNGALSIAASSGVVGDLAASVSMDLNVDQLQLRPRAAGDFTNAGLKDIGLSMVSPKIAVNGTLSYAPDATGAKAVFWNTASGAVAGKNNVARLSGSGVAKNARMSEQFNSVDADGYVLQPLALKPVVIPPPPIDPEVPAPEPGTPEDLAPLQPAFVRPVQFDLMNWSLGYRDETLEPSGHIWVIRTLGINGRWDNLGEILRTRSAERRFLEL